MTHEVSDGDSLKRAVEKIKSGETGGAHTITLKSNLVSPPIDFTGADNTVKAITIKGDETLTLRSSTNDGTPFFTVQRGVTLVLESGVTLDGDNQAVPLVSVEGGTFIMKSGSMICGAKASGVYVKKGTFIMEGGTISGNSASNGGGVYVDRSGTFIKRGRSTIDASNSAPNGKVACAYDVQRNSAAGQGVNMDSRLSGSAGGWE
jgi:hypothetical protein